jgi:hypothetical protein
MQPGQGVPLYQHLRPIVEEKHYLEMGFLDKNVDGGQIMDKRTITKSIVISIAACLGMVSMAMAGIFVVVDHGTVKIHDAKTGAYKRSIATPGAIAASSDGETIAVVMQDGSAKRYDAKGNYRGHVGSGRATGVQVSSGLIIITYENGSTRTYDAKTGSPKGSF